MTTLCKSVHLTSFVDDRLPESKDFEIIETQIETGNLNDGEISVVAYYMSVDPYLRGQIKSTNTSGMKAGDKMKGFISGKVVGSNSKQWQVGDLIGVSAAFSTVQVIDTSTTIAWNLTGVITEDKLSYGIGVLGMPGSTAYGGFIDVLRPEEKQTVFVSGAAGAVGSMVGQIAKIKGCKTIGSCGGPAKCDLIKSKFSFDHCIDYKKYRTTDELKAALKEVAPDGIDMYFENVGGIHFEAAFESLRKFGRIAVCGGISQYNKLISDKVKINPMAMIYSYQRVEGFICLPWLSGQKGNFLKDMAKWVEEGKIKVEETVYTGIENWPVAFRGLFEGKNTGKAVVQIK